MKISELIASLKAISNNRKDLPVQVYDFTDNFQLDSIELETYYWCDHTFLLVAKQQKQKQKITMRIKKFISELECLKELFLDLEIQVRLPDGTQYFLAEVEFNKKKQVYAITLGDSTATECYSGKTIVASFNDWEPLA